MSAQPQFLILGATGSIGYAVTKNLLARHRPVTLLVRQRAKAEALLGCNPLLTIIEGDVQDAGLLKQVAAGIDFIFHGINYPYHQWSDKAGPPSALCHVIDAADTGPTQPVVTIVFPGNVYNFGAAGMPIREDSVPAPLTRKGQLRVELEAMLEQAADAGRCRVLNIRLPDFWGPNVTNEGIAPIFEGALTGKAMPWLVNADIPHQSVYTPDAAEIIVRLMLRQWTTSAAVTTPDKSLPYEVWNYGGVVWPSMRAWFGRITTLTGKRSKVLVYSRLFVRLLGLFLPILREVNEMLYLYENTIVLDDRRVRSLFPDFRETPVNQALTTTLNWFAERKKVPFTPVAGAPDCETTPALNPSIS